MPLLYLLYHLLKNVLKILWSEIQVIRIPRIPYIDSISFSIFRFVFRHCQLNIQRLLHYKNIVNNYCWAYTKLFTII